LGISLKEYRPRLIEYRVLRKLLLLKSYMLTGDGGNYTLRSFLICSHQIFSSDQIKEDEMDETFGAFK
jgi:hypothetical protein